MPAAAGTGSPRLLGHWQITSVLAVLRFGASRDHVIAMRTPKPPSVLSAPFMMAELAWASWETIARRSLMMAQNTCSLAEYNRMIYEKTAATLEIGRVLASPVSASVEALLQPLHSRATANAKRLRKR